MSQFKVGDRVRCVNDDPKIYRNMLPQNISFSNYMSGLKKGEVYTVRSTAICEIYQGFDEGTRHEVDLNGIRVEELRHGPMDIPFGATRFELVEHE